MIMRSPDHDSQDSLGPEHSDSPAETTISAQDLAWRFVPLEISTGRLRIHRPHHSLRPPSECPRQPESAAGEVPLNSVLYLG